MGTGFRKGAVQSSNSNKIATTFWGVPSALPLLENHVLSLFKHVNVPYIVCFGSVQPLHLIFLILEFSTLS